MKITNPLGRDLKRDGRGIKPLACMCRKGIGFSSALGDADNCSHCGCNCWPHNHGANASTASNTSRTSV